jgi:hypothetical protein
MTYTGFAWQVINWLSVPVLAVVLGILCWRKLYREYPIFFWYLVATEAAGVVRFFAISRGVMTYFYVYWISDIIVTILNFLAVYELFVKRIFPKFYKVGLYRYLFPAFAAGSILLAWFAALAPRNMSALALEDRILDAAVVATLIFFGLLMLVIGRQWTRYDFAIAFGFALSSSAFLLATTIWMQSHYQDFSAHIPVIAYDVTSLIWLFAFRAPEKTPQHANITPELVSEARAWQSVLRNWISSKKS